MVSPECNEEFHCIGVLFFLDLRLLMSDPFTYVAKCAGKATPHHALAREQIHKTDLAGLVELGSRRLG